MKYVLCMGSGHKWMPDVARLSGWEYGFRYDHSCQSDTPYMIDIRWKNYNWAKYIEKVKKYKPFMAMVADYEYPSQRKLMYQQIRELKPLVQRVMVCPKFIGAAAHIPSWCIIAVSVISDYAGFEPPPQELRGREIHLLGGNFNRQADMMRKYNAYGEVVSLDSASHIMGAYHKRYFHNGRWIHLKERECSVQELAILSGKNIIAWFEAIKPDKQPSLF